MNLDTLDRYSSRPVREIAKLPGPAAEQLFNIAMGEKKNWTLPEWRDTLAELDACTESVADWRAIRE